MAFSDVDTRTMATDGKAKYTFKVAGSTESVEMTSINETELSLDGYQATVPSGYFDPTDGGNSSFLGLDFIASKLYEDLFQKSFYTHGGASVGLLTDIGENGFYRSVKLSGEYRPAGYFGTEG